MQLVGVPDPSQPPATAPLAVVRTFRAYYSPLELHHLVHLQAQHPQGGHQGQGQGQGQGQHKQLSDHRIQLYRQLAAGFIERVANRLGFPRRTIATAQKLYHRFHLHFSLVEFPYHDVSLAALLVASKLEDTLKKLRDIQIAAYQVSNLLEGGNGLGEGDSAAQEAHRPHLIGIERLILQTICFNLNLHRPLGPAPDDEQGEHAALASLLPLDQDDDEETSAASALTTGDGFRTLFRLAATLPSLPIPLQPPPPPPPAPPSPATTNFFALPQSQTAAPPPPPPPSSLSSSSSSGNAESDLKSLTRLAYLLLTDLHRTIAPLSYPPHTCAAACIYLAGYLLCSAAAAAAASQQQISDEQAKEEEGQDGVGRGGAVWDEEMEQNWAGMCESEPDDISDISQTLLDLLISLCPPPPLLAASTSTSNSNPSTSSPHLLVSPHSSLASPSESFSSLTNSATHNTGKSTTATTTSTSEREKHLLAAGCPNAFTHPALRGAKHSTTADDLMKVKIRVRAAAAAAAAAASSKEKKRRELATRDEGEDGGGVGDQAQVGLLKRARRWYALDRGLDDVGRIRDEKDLKERIRAEERAERHQQQQQQPQLATGGGGEAGMAGMVTDQERERERRERRERLKPGSVRYRF